MDIEYQVKNLDIIIVDDIIDTGLTTQYLIERMEKMGCRSVKVCALLDKRERRVVPVKIDYCGFVIPDKFVVGYGIDYNEQYRHLKHIGYLK